MLNINGVVNKNIGTDPFGRPIIQNQIYDPLNYTDVGGRRMLQPFPNNIIPTNRIDPVAKKILDSLPEGDDPRPVGEQFPADAPLPEDSADSRRSRSTTASMTNPRSPATGRNRIRTKTSAQDGLPFPISRGRVLVIRSYTVRLNFDHSLTPTTLLHLGAGVQRYRNPDSGPPSVTEYDAAGLLGIIGAPGTGYPRLARTGELDLWRHERSDRSRQPRPLPASESPRA